MSAETFEGTHAPLRCPTCRAEVVPAARFCPSCGQAIVAAQTAASEARARRKSRSLPVVTGVLIAVLAGAGAIRLGISHSHASASATTPSGDPAAAPATMRPTPVASAAAVAARPSAETPLVPPIMLTVGEGSCGNGLCQFNTVFANRANGAVEFDGTHTVLKDTRDRRYQLLVVGHSLAAVQDIVINPGMEVTLTWDVYVPADTVPSTVEWTNGVGAVTSAPWVAEVAPSAAPTAARDPSSVSPAGSPSQSSGAGAPSAPPSLTDRSRSDASAGPGFD